MSMHFTRLQLAEDMCEALQGSNLFNDAPNGLFLAAPRRTGKSTFLQADLKPALERRGIVVVYVDLWAAPQRDPGELIAEAIGRALHSHLGPIAKAAKASGLESINIAGAMKIDTSKIGRPEGSTLTEALRSLHELAKAPVALLVDEAQHSLTSESGESAMTALKSARDQLNRPGLVNLMLVMSGSDRDKLLRLVNANAAPFFGSSIKHLPLLGDDFVAHLARLIEDLRAVSLAETGRLHLQVRDTDLAMEVESVVDFCRQALQAAGQHPELDLRPGMVQCDPVRIRQALLALLDNVRKHAVPGAVLVQTRQENGWCLLRVEDQGPGIPPESAAQVFSAFRRMRDDGEAATDTGSGLGLAVVAAIARAHRGTASCRP